MKFKMAVASTKYRVHEAYTEVARTTTVYKVGIVQRFLVFQYYTRECSTRTAERYMSAFLLVNIKLLMSVTL